MREVTLTTVTGKKYLLTGDESESEVLAPYGEFEPITGQASRSDQVVPSRAGVVPGRTRYGALEFDVEFYLHAPSGEEMERVYREFRQGFKVWAPDRAQRPKPATLELKTFHPASPLYLDVWLSKPLPGAPVRPKARTSLTITASLFNPDGLFRTEPTKGTGAVKVANPGDGFIFPRLEGTGGGGVVKGPSGATWPWPSTGTPVAVDLDPRALRLAGALPEGIPPGGTGTYTVPAGVTVSYSVLYADPWA